MEWVQPIITNHHTREMAFVNYSGVMTRIAKELIYSF
jgi:hypothetical protein